MCVSHQNRRIICDAREPMTVHAPHWKGLSAVSRGGGCLYNPVMNKRRLTRWPVRRSAWWVAFAALAGFLLADLT